MAIFRGWILSRIPPLRPRQTLYNFTVFICQKNLINSENPHFSNLPYLMLLLTIFHKKKKKTTQNSCCCSIKTTIQHGG